ncbi:MAG TPA: hypothetical protein VGR06_22845, partial [Actinophytocola sp.]|nr:hypothetical protein [Actinophytocola sp.]
LPERFHFHDLRHTGDHLASRAGASTRELMHRMGHASERAALIYQHATRERDRQIARDMDRLIQREGQTISAAAETATGNENDRDEG